ncbi:MAG: hypothetical protein C5B59_09520 [Bacteroidetes bacterium]|nr:MAG: hypothetical protein C5B59_09520 [Bacteroidota bacterium]
MVKRIAIYIGILLGIEVVLLTGLILTSMTDERPPAIAGYIGWVLRYPFGFPLVLVNQNYPYFLNGGATPIWFVIPFVIFNDFLLALGIIGFISLFRKILAREQ